jgi:hypothetical protein
MGLHGVGIGHELDLVDLHGPKTCQELDLMGLHGTRHDGSTWTSTQL